MTRRARATVDGRFPHIVEMDTPRDNIVRNLLESSVKYEKEGKQEQALYLMERAAKWESATAHPVYR